MGAKRKNNGIGPGKVVKNICDVPMTKADRARLAKACDKFDATEGWVAEQALHSWLNWKGIR